MVAFDTNIFIYILEDNPEFGRVSAASLRDAKGQGVASMLVYAELLSAPVFNNHQMRDAATRFLDSQTLHYVELSKAILLRAAGLRAASARRLGLGDALHLACALQAGADTFITNDRELAKASIGGIKIVTF